MPVVRYIVALVMVWHMLLVPREPVYATSTVGAAYGYTYIQPDGNRFMPGRGPFPHAVVRDIDLPGPPLWLVAASLGHESVWVVALADGRLLGFRMAGNQHTPEPVSLRGIAPAAPPALAVRSGQTYVLNGLAPALSPMTHPVLLADAPLRIAFIDTAGDLVVWQEHRGSSRLAVNALPDARLLHDGTGQLLVLTDPTARYGHNVLGDSLEAASLTRVTTIPSLGVVQTVTFPAPAVAEGLAPIWADLTGDGRRDIIVTLSDAQQGARLAVFDEAGAHIARGPAIGQGYRWRQQLAVAPFGPDGQIELAVVRTPHIGGIVEYYRMVGDTLRIEAQLTGLASGVQDPGKTQDVLVGDFVTIPQSGFGSHILGSRNLDMAMAGDFDADGQVELLVPVQTRTHLSAIRRIPGGAKVAWSLPLDGVLSTNLAAVSLPNGMLAIGAGVTPNRLRLWLPRP